MINCEGNLILAWSPTCVITNSRGEERFTITDTKLYVPLVTLSTQCNAQFPQQLKSGFKRTINRNKDQLFPKTYAPKRYLNNLADLSFEVANRIFVLSFEKEDDRRSHSGYYLRKVEIKDYNVIIDGRNFFDQPINNDFKTYKNIRKIATVQGDD